MRAPVRHTLHSMGLPFEHCCHILMYLYYSRPIFGKDTVGRPGLYPDTGQL